MLSARRPGRDVLGGRLLPLERRGARRSVVVPVPPPNRLYPYPPPSDEGNCGDVCGRLSLVTSYQVPMRLIGLVLTAGDDQVVTRRNLLIGLGAASLSTPS